MPRRRTIAAAALPLLVAAAGSAVLAVRTRQAKQRAVRRAAGRYQVFADMGRHDFRSVIWTTGDPDEALRLAAGASSDFGRTWVEGPDEKAPVRR